MLDDMQNLIDKQQDLLDQTFRDAQEQQQQSQQGQEQQGQQQQPGTGGPQQAAKQEGLRGALGDMMRRYSDMMGDIPQSLGRAEGEMRESSRALGEGRPSDAVPPQSRALSELQQALQDMTNKMAEALQAQQGRTGRDQFGTRRRPARPRRRTAWARPSATCRSPNSRICSGPRKFSRSCAAAPASVHARGWSATISTGCSSSSRFNPGRETFCAAARSRVPDYGSVGAHEGDLRPFVRLRRIDRLGAELHDLPGRRRSPGRRRRSRRRDCASSRPAEWRAVRASPAAGRRC